MSLTMEVIKCLCMRVRGLLTMRVIKRLCMRVRGLLTMELIKCLCMRVRGLGVTLTMGMESMYGSQGVRRMEYVYVVDCYIRYHYFHMQSVLATISQTS